MLQLIFIQDIVPRTEGNPRGGTKYLLHNFYVFSSYVSTFNNFQILF